MGRKPPQGKRPLGASADPEQRGQELIEALNETLNEQFAARDDYRAAIESAHSFLEAVIAGLDDDDRRDAR